MSDNTNPPNSAGGNGGTNDPWGTPAQPPTGQPQPYPGQAYPGQPAQQPGQPGQPGQPQGAPAYGQYGQYTSPAYGNAPAGPGGFGGYPEYAAPLPKGMAITSLVLGIIALLLGCLVLPGIILGPTAIILGILGMRRASRGVGGGRGMAIAGTVLGGLGLVAAIVTVLFAMPFIAEYKTCLDKTSASAQDACLKSLQRSR